MCGRFTLRAPAHALAAAFKVAIAANLAPRYNIAPTQPVAVVRTAPAPAGKRVRAFALLRWGLIPAWAKDAAIGARLINARAETLAEKPAFRAAYRARRCLVLADGFYEWQRTTGGGKQPWFIRRADDAPFAFAGLWEVWRGGAGEAVESCAIVTTGANARLAAIHDRMPAILTPEAADLWLAPDQPPARLAELLRPAPEEALVAHPVDRRVNSPANDDPACIAPLAPLNRRDGDGGGRRSSGSGP